MFNIRFTLMTHFDTSVGGKILLMRMFEKTWVLGQNCDAVAYFVNSACMYTTMNKLDSSLGSLVTSYPLTYLLHIVEKHNNRALWETCDPWDMLSERWRDMTWTTKLQWQRQWQWHDMIFGEHVSKVKSLWWGDMTWLTKRQRHLENTLKEQY